MKYLLLLLLFVSTILAESQLINIDTIKKSSNKQIMIFFHMNNCGYCNRMNNQTLKNKEIKQIIKKNFILVDINIDDEDTIIYNKNSYQNRSFASILDVKFFPTIIFLDEDKEISYKARGFRTIKKFQHILNFMKTKSFEEMSFFDYLQIEDKE